MSVDEQLMTFVLILARVSAFVAFLPLFAKRQLPNLVKAGLAVGLSVFWYGTLPEELAYQGAVDTITSLLFLAKEIGLGFILSALIGFMLIPARIAGSYIGQEIGLSLAAISSPGTSDSSTLVTTILETICVLLFFGLNLHHFMILFLHHSLIELGGRISLTDLPTELLTDIVQSICTHGFEIAGPIGICLFVLTIGLALLNRAAPSFNLFSVGMTARSGLGLLCMLLFFPLIVRAMESHFEMHQIHLEQFLIYFE